MGSSKMTDVVWGGALDRARKGDPRALASMLRKSGFPVSKEVRAFLADLVEKKVAVRKVKQSRLGSLAPMVRAQDAWLRALSEKEKKALGVQSQTERDEYLAEKHGISASTVSSMRRGDKTFGR